MIKLSGQTHPDSMSVHITVDCSEELVILKCLIYKNSNALRSFKFFKSLKYCLRRFESLHLVRRDNKTDSSIVRLELDVIQRLGKGQRNFIQFADGT